MHLCQRLTSAQIPREKNSLGRCAPSHAPPTEPHRRLGTAFHSAHSSMDQRRENPMARGRVSMEGVGCIQTAAPQRLTLML